MLKRQTIDNVLSRAGRALRKGSEILKTLAYLLDPEDHPEPAEEPSRGNHDPFEDVPGYPVAGTYPVIIPPEAEEMIRKANLPKPSREPSPPLTGSLEARGKVDTFDPNTGTWSEQHSLRKKSLSDKVD